MFTIVHLSDIHRSEADPISNDELISCLVSDCGRFALETPLISQPDAIIVSGDLVQGLPIGSAQYPSGLRQQYDEALEFLIRLAKTFLQNDRSRLIFVPGNHDVDWNQATRAMVKINHAGRDVPRILSQIHSPFRWCWKTHGLLEITDQALYRDRMRPFVEMYAEFYRDIIPRFPLDAKRPWNLFELDNGKMVVCGFDSCIQNDCYNNIGFVSAEAISRSHLELEKHGGDRKLAIAVWHHDIQGPPLRSDYMDQESVRIMIDRGYRLCLHGHQHKSDASPVSVHSSERHKATVVSAGSLCAGQKDLPQGFNRQYNVIEISDDYMSATVHVREMNLPNIFSQGRLTAWGGKSYAKIDWSAVPRIQRVDSGRTGGAKVATLEKIERLITEKSFGEAIELIDLEGSAFGNLARQLKTRTLFESQSWESLVHHLDEPRNADEVTKCVKALVALRDWQRAEAVLRRAADSGDYPDPFIRDIKGWLRAEKGVRG